MTADYMLEVTNLSKSFGGVLANDAISIVVPRGSIAGLIGPNGSGKTTLFNCIVGYHAVDTGSVRFGGREVSRLSVAQIARLGLLRTFQKTEVFGGLTCLQNMQIALSHAHEPRRAMFRRVPSRAQGKERALLDFVGLQAKDAVLARDLSFGQQKLLEIAMTLIGEPKMLLFDEPGAGINPSQMNAIIDLLRRTRDSLGITLLVIEHNMRIISNLADRIHCLAHGRLLAEGTPEEIRADPRVIDAYLGAR